MITDPASNVHSALPQVTFGRNSSSSSPSSSSDSFNWYGSTCNVRLNSEMQGGGGGGVGGGLLVSNSIAKTSPDRKKQMSEQNTFQKKQSALIVTASSFHCSTHQVHENVANSLLISHVQPVQALEATMKARDALKGCTLQASIPDLEKHSLPSTYNGAYANDQFREQIKTFEENKLAQATKAAEKVREREKANRDMLRGNEVVKKI